MLEGIHPESSRIQLHSHVGASAEFTFPTIMPNPGTLAGPHCLRAVPSCLHTAHTDNIGVHIKNESAECISFKSSSTYTQHLPFWRTQVLSKPSITISHPLLRCSRKHSSHSVLLTPLQKRDKNYNLQLVLQRRARWSHQLQQHLRHTYLFIISKHPSKS